MPPALATRARKVLLPASVVAVLQDCEPTTLPVALLQLVPLSYDTCIHSPAPSTLDSVPLMVCAAVPVMKSVPLVPVSADSVAPVTVVVGGGGICCTSVMMKFWKIAYESEVMTILVTLLIGIPSAEMLPMLPDAGTPYCVKLLPGEPSA